MSDDWDDMRRSMAALYPIDTGPVQRFDTPLDLARASNPTINRTSALELINQLLVDLMATPNGRGIISMSPQEGKTTLVMWLILWVLRDAPDTKVGVTSNDASLARTMGRQLRDAIRDYGSTLGLRLRRDVSAQGEFQLLGRRGGVYSIGIGGSLTGRGVDLLIIDDPVKNSQQADSELIRERTYDWWQTTASTRLGPGGQAIVVMTRWHEDDLAGKLLSGEDKDRWRHVSIPAQADHNPEKGQTDPLGRVPGEFMQSARIDKTTGRPRTVADWEDVKREKGSRAWTAMYQQRPSPAEGGILKRGWWQQYDAPLWLVRDNGSRWVTGFDAMLMSWDMAFKDTSKSDYVCGQVWMRRGADAYLLDQVCDRMDFVTTCQKFRELAARWPQAVRKLVEDKANGTAVINSLARIVPGIIPEEPHGSKEARASAVAPLVEAKNVFLPSPELAPWVGDLIEQAAAFPNGKHDDMVDALSQGLNRLIVMPLLAGDTFTTEDLDPDSAHDFDYVSAY